MKFSPIRSEKFVFSLIIGNQRFSLFKLQFQKRDGSVLIHVPYLTESNGILSLCTFPPGVSHVKEISFIDNARVTSHLVKLSHHPDGNAHFSQDGKIFTKIRNQSTPLSETNGHLFSITTKGYPLSENKKTKKDTKSLEFYLKDAGSLPPIKVLGYYYAKPSYDIINSHLSYYLCAAPDSYPLSTSMVLVKVFVFPYSTPNEKDFTLIGGFGPNINIDEELRFISLTYPAENFEELKERIGSADL